MFRLRRAMAGAAILAAAAAVSEASWGAAAHAGHGPVLELRVEVSREGLNGDPALAIEVERGQHVEITFVWADEVVPGNAHRMYIRGYELSTELLSADHRTHTLRFVANQPGTFEVVCVWPCEGHLEALQGGRLRVKPSGAAGGSPVATSLVLKPSSLEVAGGSVTLSATLKDAHGNPIPDVVVRFYVEARLAGTSGSMEIGATVTDADGLASLNYTPTFAGDQLVTARFSGVGLQAESEGKVPLRVVESQPAYAPTRGGLEPLPRWAAAGLLATVLGVWSIFAYVLYEALRIRRAAD